MRKTTRRKFLGASLTALAGTIGLVASRNLYSEEGSSLVVPDDFVMPTAALGSTGLRPSLLGLGTGSNGWGGRSQQTELGQRQFVSLLEYAHDRGVTYFDLADQYGSHPFMSKALQSGGGIIDREKCFLLSKTHARDAASMRADLDRFRREIGTDYLDSVLLHCEVTGSWNKDHAGAMEVLQEAKASGIVKSHGVSCHSISAFRTACREPFVDVHLVRLNPWGMHMDGDVPTIKGLIEKEMRPKGMGVIGMKILAQGEANTPEKLDQAISHAMNSGLLDCFTIGVGSRKELDELLALMAKHKKLTSPV